MRRGKPAHRHAHTRARRRSGARRRGQGRMFALPCLDGGLLIDAENVISRPQRCTFPAASIQIDDAARLAGEVRVAGKIQLRWRQGRNASWPSQRQSVVPLILATIPQATASCRSSATDQRAKGRQLTGQRFDRDHDIGGKSALVARRAVGRPDRAADRYRTAGATCWRSGVEC
jgi:hypothetical protein